MSSRPARAEADLLEAELSALIKNYSSLNIELTVGQRFNDVLDRISRLLEDDLSTLL